jgi:predicted Na+-dependent transporter
LNPGCQTTRGLAPSLHTIYLPEAGFQAVAGPLVCIKLLRAFVASVYVQELSAAAKKKAKRKAKEKAAKAGGDAAPAAAAGPP